MKVKITPTGESAQVMEFNVSLPCGANASIAPVSTLTVTQRWAKVVNVSTTGTEYVQVTKFDVIHNIQYTDCKGNVRVSTESTSTIMETAATSETITTLTPTVTKVIDVIIPNGVSIVSQQVLDELPTSLPVKGHIHAQLKAKEDKVNTLLELVEQDPEIKKRLDEVMLSKSK